MTIQNRLVALLLSALLAACGGGDRPAAGEQAASTPAAATQQQAREAGQPTGPTGTMPVEESAADSTAESAPTVLAQAETPDQPAPARQWRFPAGRYYSKLTEAQGTSGGAGGIEVDEFFWYGCPHCFNFDPYVSRWAQTLGEDVRFVRVPVMWNPTNEIHARIFYTAEALGKLAEMHGAIFNAIHREKKTLTREDDIRDFFGQFGVSADEFDKAFRSFTVESRLRRARSLTQRYRIRSVPVMVVNGRYVTDGPEIKSFDEMLAVVDELVERERQGL